AELAFEAQGFSHARNAPYAGGYTTHLHGRRDRDVHALQVEINRALYLDEERIAKGPRFEAVHMRLNEARHRLSPFSPGSWSPAGVATTWAVSRGCEEKRPLPRERPSSGRKRPGRAGGITNGRLVMPRCNNMDPRQRTCKSKLLASCHKNPVFLRHFA